MGSSVNLGLAGEDGGPAGTGLWPGLLFGRMVVVGDFNCEPSDLFFGTGFLAKGYMDQFELHRQRTGAELPPTCRGGYDTALLHPALLSCGPGRRWWSLPALTLTVLSSSVSASLSTLRPPRDGLCPSANVDELAAGFQAWSAAVEQAVSATLSSQHSRGSVAPPGQVSAPRLPRAMCASQAGFPSLPAATSAGQAG